MNWAGISIALGLFGLAIFAMPYGLVIIAGMVWMWRKG